ncbi:MAG TPA: condensation domain-containing protein, partial [Micromonospora sp.]
MIPLSYTQQRLWFFSRMEGGPTYNIPLALRLRGRLDRDALRDAVADVVDRHEALRTVFPEVDGEPRQRIVPSRDARPAVDATPVTAAGLADALSRAARHCFDLTAELPLRVDLFEVADDDHALLLLMHHIVSDGWSIGPLTRDLETAYRARHAGLAPQWAELPVQYADYALWQQELLGDVTDPTSGYARQLRYWTGTLAGLPEELPLPTDRPRPAAASYAGNNLELTVDADTHRRLAGIGRNNGATLFMVLQAALATLLTRLGAGTDV